MSAEVKGNPVDNRGCTTYLVESAWTDRLPILLTWMLWPSSSPVDPCKSTLRSEDWDDSLYIWRRKTMIISPEVIKTIKRMMPFCILLLFIGYMLYPSLTAGMPRWPKIADPARLLKDCTGLLACEGEIPKERWPGSIRDLSPDGCVTYPQYGCVDLGLSGGGTSRGWGFEVYPDGRSTTKPLPGHRSAEPVCPGIFKYETEW